MNLWSQSIVVSVVEGYVVLWQTAPPTTTTTITVLGPDGFAAGKKRGLESVILQWKKQSCSGNFLAYVRDVKQGDRIKKAQVKEQVMVQEKFIGAQHSVWTHVALSYTSHISELQYSYASKSQLICPPPLLLFFCAVLKKLFARTMIPLPSKSRGRHPRNVSSKQQ